MLTRTSLSQEREEGGEAHEGEVEAIELEEEPEVEEEGLEKREEDDDGEMEVQVNEVVEVEEAEEMTELIPSSQDEEIYNADEAENFYNTNEEIPADVSDQVRVQEQENFNQNSEDEREDGEEEAIEDDFTKQKSEEEMEEEMEASQPHVDETEQDLERGSEEMKSLLDLAQIQKHPDDAASSKTPPLHLSDSLFTHSQESAVRPSSNTAIMHINLASPSSEKDGSLFPQSPTAAHPSKSVTESPSGADSSSFTEQYQVSVDEEHDKDHDEKHDDAVEVVEEKQPAQEQEESSPANVEEVVPQSPDQSKVRFTIAPAWQRSQNLTSPPSPPACISSPKEDDKEEEAETIKNQDTKPEPVSATKPELVLSPGRGTNAGSTTAKPQSNATPTPGKPPAPASTVGKNYNHGEAPQWYFQELSLLLDFI